MQMFRPLETTILCMSRNPLYIFVEVFGEQKEEVKREKRSYISDSGRKLHFSFCRKQLEESRLTQIQSYCLFSVQIAVLYCLVFPLPWLFKDENHYRARHCLRAIKFLMLERNSLCQPFPVREGVFLTHCD